MLSFIARRLGLLIPTFFGVTLLTFALIRLIPGDPVEVMMGERRVDPQMHAEALHRLGLDKPLYQQYLDYVGNLAQGNLGESLTILLSSLVGAILGVIMLRLRNAESGTPIPFGPYLAIAGWIALLWGDQITRTYLQFAGFK